MSEEIKKVPRVHAMLVTQSGRLYRQIGEFLKSDHTIEIAQQLNGIDAVSTYRRKGTDVVIMDVSDPDGDWLMTITRLRKLDARAMIILVSSAPERRDHPRSHADGLAHGAADFIAVPMRGADAVEKKAFAWKLNGLIHALSTARRQLKPSRDDKQSPFIDPPSTSTLKPKGYFLDPVKLRAFPKTVQNVIAVASSTGGPRALMAFFGGLPRDLACPIFITQHMPAGFTSSLARAITQKTGWPCHEGVDGMEVLPGYVYLAPGGVHMLVEKSKPHPRIRLSNDAPENFCKPSADPMLRSMAEVYGSRVLVVVLTGMGHDGMEGSRQIVSHGGAVIAQDRETSVVWGMPGAVAASGLCSALEPIDAIAGAAAKVLRKTP